MKDIPIKANGNTVDASEWNSPISTGELKNAVTSSGQTLSEADSFQLSKAMAIYAADGTFYRDTGVANAYVLSSISPRKAPIAYTDGMFIRFKATHANTGASTINVNGIGVKSIKNRDGSALQSGEIGLNDYVDLVFELSNNYFVITNKSDVSSNIPFGIAVESAANTYTLDLGGVYNVYDNRMYFRCRFPTANTGAISLNIESLGAKSVVSNIYHDSLAANEIRVNETYLIAYNVTLGYLMLINHPVREETMDYPNFGLIGGTSSALTLTPSPAVRALENNMFFLCRMGLSSNNANATLNINGLGAKKIYAEGLDLLEQIEADTLRSGVVYLFSYYSGFDSGSGGFILLEIAGATVAETQANTIKTKFISPYALAQRTATTSRTGIAELAQTSELTVIPAVNATKIVTPAEVQSFFDARKATSAEVKTGTISTKFAPISEIIQHKGVAKAWYSASVGSSGILTQREAWNCSATRISAGVYDITLAFNMTTVYFMPVGICSTQTPPPNSFNLIFNFERVVALVNKFRITCDDRAGAGLQDPDFFTIVVFGDKA